MKSFRRCNKKRKRYCYLLSVSGTVAKLKQQHMEDYLDIMEEFEVKKRSLAATNKVNLRIPQTFQRIFKEENYVTLASQQKESNLMNKIKFLNDKLRIDSEVIKTLFENPIKDILSHVQMLLSTSECASCKTIVMVGGFSDSPVLQDSIKKRFPCMNYIIPREAELAVVQGAVIFGNRPTAITERVCKYTYGVGTTHPYSPVCKFRHPPTEVITGTAGNKHCVGSFDAHVRSGTVLQIGQEIKSDRVYCPLNEDQTRVEFVIYRTNKTKLQLVTEPSCTKIGIFFFDIPDHTMGTQRKFTIAFFFGGTELMVEGTDLSSGEKKRLRIDCL